MASQLKDAYGFALLATGEDQRLLQASWAAVSKIKHETAQPTPEQQLACSYVPFSILHRTCELFF
jgi:hypothetical protein